METLTVVLGLIGIVILAIYKIGNPPDDVKLPAHRKRGGFHELLTTIEYATKGPKLLQEGYNKFKNTGYIFYTFGWRNIVLTKMEHIMQLRMENENLLSSNGFMDYQLQAEYNLPGHLERANGNVKLTTSRQRMVTLTKTRLGDGAWMDVIWDELVPAWNDAAQARGITELQWSSVETDKICVDVIARAANRVLVGPKLCTNREYLHVMCEFTKACSISAEMLKWFPTFVKPLVHRMFSKTPWCYHRAEELLADVISDAYEKTKAGLVKAEDETFLQWLISRETKAENTPLWRRGMVRNMVLINFAAIHTTAIHLTKCIYELAARPEYISSLRAEISEKLAQNSGVLDYPTLEKMWALDSFVKEVQRLSPQSTSMLSRLSIKPFTFSDGTTIPAGSLVHVCGGAILRDNAYYPNPDTFDGNRFLKLRLAATTEAEAAQYKFSSTSPTMPVFGDGKRTCPGRWLASMQIRAALVCLLTGWDLELNGGNVPPSVTFGPLVLPSPSGRVLMKKRKEE